ncbi:MAG: hypothetical protein ACYTEX_25665 [Planctomycetota bacterium]
MSKFRKWFVVCTPLLLWLCSCEDTKYGSDIDNAKPVIELAIETVTGSAFTCGDLLGAAGHDIVRVWEWSDLKKKADTLDIGDRWMPDWKTKSKPYPRNRGWVLVSGGRVLGVCHGEPNTVFIMRDIKRTEELRTWPMGSEWHCQQLRNTRNGRFAGVLVREEYGRVHVAGRSRHGRYQLGRIDTESGEIQWASTVYRNDSFMPKVRRLAVSEDGKYVAGVGTSNGGYIHVADVVQQKILWEKIPRGQEVPLGGRTINFNDVRFSPDSKYIYVAGNVGLLCFDVATGKILSQWPVTGGRCVGVAVSPDGKLVAGGAGGSGLVSIYEAATGKLLQTFKTGQYTIYCLTFSPDGKLLATMGVMNTNVKIWKMPTLAPSTEKDDKAVDGRVQG